ncbi:protein with SnoaL 3 domain, NTF 2 superfamily [candidate division KSB3 bacterium]|uniref:Protein with SnoaL 3 domain, NTF 2 superfamily n=1 Tax=candidate division KSB3 bacterium TaxID=2044937 RepID=A0A2G6E1F2_9BACT|nr:MAG: protein with SnoaL 3 domain, NTF 2 superfamily [candidate division KSB3 bacterium]
MKGILSVFVVVAVIGCLSVSAFAVAVEEEKANIDAVLTALHDAASKADGERYFSLYADNAIFYGTDSTERWTLDEFKEWAIPYFAKGKGWTYTMTERNIYLDADGNTAWFDERLMNEKYGDCRGTGALTMVDGQWKIVQYNLTFPVPNSIALDVIQMIKEAPSE